MGEPQSKTRFVLCISTTGGRFPSVSVSKPQPHPYRPPPYCAMHTPPDSCHRGTSVSGRVEVVEDVARGVGEGVGGGVLVAGDGDGDLLQGPKGPDDFLDAQAGRVL